MAVRTSMAALISRLRNYIGDPASASQHFSDQQMQDQLDLHRFTVRYASLKPGPTLKPGSLYTFLDYYAEVGDWEDDYTLQWVNFATITPVTAEPLAGHWVFNQPDPGYFPPVWITGKYYDLHAAAADLLDQWILSLAFTTYDFSSDGQSFKRSQILATLQNQADRHRMQARPSMGIVHRDDLSLDGAAFTTFVGGTMP